MIPILKTAVSLLLSVVSLFAAPIFGKFAQKIEPSDAQNIKFSASIISDIHFDTNRPLSPYVLEMGLYDMQNASRQNDALIMLGDVTNHGYEEQYQMLENTLKKYSPAKRLVLVEGNHDT
ncbi:MAG TPA: hypothetical protein DDY98_05655, partial [Ruminococcaceae bacterium]|nr:hypothetical protein [Oscillospiraceae bacterium]